MTSRYNWAVRRASTPIHEDDELMTKNHPDNCWYFPSPVIHALLDFQFILDLTASWRKSNSNSRIFDFVSRPAIKYWKFKHFLLKSLLQNLFGSLLRNVHEPKAMNWTPNNWPIDCLHEKLGRRCKMRPSSLSVWRCWHRTQEGDVWWSGASSDVIASLAGTCPVAEREKASDIWDIRF